MGVCKTGTWIENEIHEFNAVENYDSNTYSYIPTKDVQNSCLNGWTVDLSQYSSSVINLTIRIEIDIDYEGFDFSTAAGTAKLYWQGSNYSIVENAWKWAGTNYLTTALNNQQNLLNLVNGTGSGTYHYNNTIVIPVSWWETYSQSHVGVRCDYSNGIGKITLKNLKVYLDDEFGNGNARINSNQNIIANNFIEI